MTVVKHCSVWVPITIKGETDQEVQSLVELAKADVHRALNKPFWRRHLTYLGEPEAAVREPA